MRRILLIFSLLFFAGQARAVITVTGVSGVSSWTATTPTTTTTPTPTTPTAGSTTAVSILGGTAGTDCSGSNQTSTCDSCKTTTTCTEPTLLVDQAPLCACNTTRISNGLVIRIAITRSPATTIHLIHASSGGSPGTEIGPSDYATPPATDGGNSVSFFWSSVCRLMTPSSNTCEGLNGSLVLTVWVDNNDNNVFDAGDESLQVTLRVISPGLTENIFSKQVSEGVGKFTPFPGDGKAYIINLDTTTNFPNLTYGSLIGSVRVYVSDKNMDNATAIGAFKTQDLTVTSGADTLDQDFIDDLDNGKGYFFRVAMVDQGGNAVQFFPDITDLQASNPECFGAGANAALCPYGVIPDQVLGLLSKDFNCFVATAAYGSSFEPKLKILRDFRQFILLRHDWGKRFVFSYYQYGPYAARYIADKPVLRAIARGFLWPVFGFSWLALKIGLLNSFLLSLILMSSVLALPWIGLRRFKSS